MSRRISLVEAGGTVTAEEAPICYSLREPYAVGVAVRDCLEVEVVFGRVGVVVGEVAADGEHVMWTVREPSWFGLVLLWKIPQLLVVVALQLGTVDV